MTSFFSPERPRLGNGRPCWLSRQVALPALHLTPDRELERQWIVEIILVDHWVGGVWGPSAVQELLRDWRDDPEATLRKWFGEEPPREGPTTKAQLVVQEVAGTASASAEELDL